MALQTFLLQPVKKQMSHRSVPRRAPDPAEFLSGTTPRLSTICSTSSRRASSETGGHESEAKKDGNSSRKDVQPKKAKYDNKKAIASAVEKKVAEKMKEIEQAKKKQDVDEPSIMSLIEKFAIAGKTGRRLLLWLALLRSPSLKLSLQPLLLSRVISRINEAPLKGPGVAGLLSQI